MSRALAYHRMPGFGDAYDAEYDRQEQRAERINAVAADIRADAKTLRDIASDASADMDGDDWHTPVALALYALARNPTDNTVANLTRLAEALADSIDSDIEQRATAKVDA